MESSELANVDEKASFDLCIRLAPVFNALQKIDSNKGTKEMRATVSMAARNYRQILKDLKGEGHDVMGEVWELIEIMMVDSEVTGIDAAGNTLESLMEWCQKHNRIPDQLKSLAIDADSNSEQPLPSNQNYFDAVAGHLLCADMENAVETLKLHPKFDESGTNEVCTLVEFILSKPLLAEFANYPINQYQTAFDNWQQDLTDALENDAFQDDNIVKLVGILCGDEEIIDTCLHLTGQWYRLLLAKCYYTCPTIDPRTVIHSSSVPPTLGALENTILNQLINRIFELDKEETLRMLVSLSNSWWPSAHMADLIFKSDPKNTKIQELREHFVKNYAESLLKQRKLFKTGLRYVLSLTNRQYVREKLNAAILGIDVAKEPELEKLYRLPSELKLTAVMYLQRRIAEKAARHFIDAQDYGSSLCWAIRANNDSICSEIAEKILNKFNDQEDWELPLMINKLGRCQEKLPKKLIFLYKYKQFHSKLKDHDSQEAMNDLEALLKYDMKAAILSLVLRQAMVLLDHEVMFKQKQITTIMKALQRLTYLQKVKDEADVEQANLLRKSLGEHLTRIILKKQNL